MNKGEKNVFEMKMIAILCHKTVKLALKISLEIRAVYQTCCCEAIVKFQQQIMSQNRKLEVIIRI